ncbi:hypothetical protein NQ315_012624 [Exocentrus adspersus]|uniref:Uncharacterized protein n=1 Tax=Exocentrus adspersus TaxID=1586481 RepID=A0AAV8VSM8_9CUCU|nr:hypothetical protein NQ315_012624 [Exocentrus adspersus]
MPDHKHLQISAKVKDEDKHTEDVTCIAYHKGKVYTGSDDCCIKVYDTNLNKIGEVEAHESSVFSVAASDEHLYSCSDEGTIKTFDLDTLKEESTVVKDEQTEYWKLFYTDGYLYSGDNLGNVIVWKHGKEIGETNIAEPIRDLAVSGNFLFTVKHSDLVVTELHLDSIRIDEEMKRQIKFASKAVHPGRAPLGLIGSKYVACADRQEGKNIIVIENSDESHFKHFTKINNASEMLINAIAGTEINGETVLFSGGWDRKLKKFRFEKDQVKLDCTSDVGFVINCIAVGESGEIYVGGSDGELLRLEIEWKD